MKSSCCKQSFSVAIALDPAVTDSRTSIACADSSADASSDSAANTSSDSAANASANSAAKTSSVPATYAIADVASDTSSSDPGSMRNNMPAVRFVKRAEHANDAHSQQPNLFLDARHLASAQAGTEEAADFSPLRTIFSSMSG